MTGQCRPIAQQEMPLGPSHWLIVVRPYGASSEVAPLCSRVICGFSYHNHSWAEVLTAPTSAQGHRRIQKRLWRGPNFEKVPQFMKTHRISLFYWLPSNINITFLNKSWFVFLLCPEICRFCAIFGRFGGGAWPPASPLDPPVHSFPKSHGLTPLSAAFLDAHHDELIEMSIFSKKNWRPRPLLCLK